MKLIIITGSTGLIGSESARYFSEKGFQVIGIDNDMRRYFFGEEASTIWNRQRLESELPEYTHYDADIRDVTEMENIFRKYGSDIELIIHTAAQPSHDWAAQEPFTDFSINATGTLIMLEMTRRYCPEAVFIFTSTNKVYGDAPNSLPLIEHEKRWEVDPSHQYARHGIDESMTIDQSTHSLFGTSKVAADVTVQEYGRYFGMKTGIFRGGCLTGPDHSGAMLHGFLAYLMKCTVTGNEYTVLGYKGKQVRDNIHSYDLVNAFYYFYNNPRKGEVYNIGGSRHANCSILEAISMCEEIAGKKLNWNYKDINRIGDHIWWISDVRKFQSHYPECSYRYGLRETLQGIYHALVKRMV